MLIRIRPQVQFLQATKGSWHYCVLSPAATKKLLAFRGERSRTRHTRAEITIGNTTWTTNIIPDKERGWLFVIKADVRKEERIEAGHLVSASLKLLPP